MTTIPRTIALLLVTACTSANPPTVCDPGGACHPAGWDGLPPLARTETLDPATLVDGIEVKNAPASATGWHLTIRNTTDQPVAFAIEDSSFTFTDGRKSRVIDSETSRVDAFRPQAAIPIAPHALWSGTVRVWVLQNAEELEAKAHETESAIQMSNDANHQKQKGAELEKLVARQRAEVARSLTGGKLALVIQRPSGAQSWIATVVAPAPEQASR